MVDVPLSCYFSEVYVKFATIFGPILPVYELPLHHVREI